MNGGNTKSFVGCARCLTAQPPSPGVRLKIRPSWRRCSTPGATAGLPSSATLLGGKNCLWSPNGRPNLLSFLDCVWDRRVPLLACPAVRRYETSRSMARWCKGSCTRISEVARMEPSEIRGSAALHDGIALLILSRPWRLTPGAVGEQRWHQADSTHCVHPPPRAGLTCPRARPVCHWGAPTPAAERGDVVEFMNFGQQCRAAWRPVHVSHYVSLVSGGGSLRRIQ